MAEFRDSPSGFPKEPLENSLASRRPRMTAPAVQTIPQDMDVSLRSRRPPEDASSADAGLSAREADWRNPSLGEVAGRTAWKSPQPSRSPPPLLSHAGAHVLKPTTDLLPDGKWLNVAPIVMDCFRKVFHEVRDLAAMEARLDKKIDLSRTHQRVNEERIAEELWQAVGDIVGVLDAEGLTSGQQDRLPRLDRQRIEQRVAQCRVHSNPLRTTSASQSSPLVRLRSSVHRASLTHRNPSAQRQSASAAQDHSGSEGLASSPLESSQQVAPLLPHAPSDAQRPTVRRGPRCSTRSPGLSEREPYRSSDSSPSVEARSTYGGRGSDSARLTADSGPEVCKVVSGSDPASSGASSGAVPRDQSKAVSSLEKQMQEAQEQLALLRSHNAAAAKRLSVLWARVHDELSDERLGDLIRHSALDAVQRLTGNRDSLTSAASAWAPPCRVETVDLMTPEVDGSPSREHPMRQPTAFPEGECHHTKEERDRR